MSIHKRYRHRRTGTVIEVRHHSSGPMLWIDQPNRRSLPHIVLLRKPDRLEDEDSWWTGYWGYFLEVEWERNICCVTIDGLSLFDPYSTTLTFDWNGAPSRPDLQEWEVTDLLRTIVGKAIAGPKTQTPIASVYNYFTNRRTGFEVKTEMSFEGTAPVLRVQQAGKPLFAQPLIACTEKVHDRDWEMIRGFKRVILRGDDEHVIISIQAFWGLGRTIAQLTFERTTGVCRVMGDWSITPNS